MTRPPGTPWRGDRTLHAVATRMTARPDEPTDWADDMAHRLSRLVQTATPTMSIAVGAILRELDAAAARKAGDTFADLPAVDQDAVLAEFAVQPDPVDAAGLAPAAAIGLLSTLCAQACWGGGPDGTRLGPDAAWEFIGYRELPPGRRWPSGDVDPAGPTIEPRQLRARYDAIIVGSGAGGAVAAMVLAEAGLQVLLAERGEWRGARDLPLDHLRSERSVTGYATATGAPPADNPRVVVTPDGPLIVRSPDPRWSANAMTVGGGTRIYGAQAWRFAPQDFTMASTYGVPDGSSLADWPIGYAEMAPWYDRAEWELGVAGEPARERFAGPRARGYPMPPIEANLGAKTLQRGADRLGLRTGPVPLLVNSVPFAGRPACLRCGACVGFACQAGAKNGTHNTVLPRALATGRCHVITAAQVTRLHTGRSKEVDAVQLAGVRHGRTWRQTVACDRVVLAAGAIETARLLLNSPSPAHPAGLGNDHDQVGRSLQAHVYAGAVGLFDQVVQDCTGPGPAIATHDFRHDNPGIVGGGMLANDFVPTPLNAWATLRDLGLIPSWGVASTEGMRHLYPRMQLVFGPVQEVPTAAARVCLSKNVRDRFGMPVVQLKGDIHPEDRRAAAFLAGRAAEWLDASGARTVIRRSAADRPPGPSGGQHQAGTCRMGHDPVRSVTDPWGRLWGHDNILVADGSVHVTNGGVNPVLTIFALAYRNSTHFVGNVHPDATSGGTQ